MTEVSVGERFVRCYGLEDTHPTVVVTARLGDYVEFRDVTSDDLSDFLPIKVFSSDYRKL